MTELLDSVVLADVLGKHGGTMKPQEYLDILREVVDATTESLTAAERSFLIETGGVAPELLTPERQASAQARITIETARADTVAERRGLTTQEVADLLGTAPANVRRSAGRGDLYTVGRGRTREHLFPVWQFHEGRPLSHVREVIAALPRGLHPLDVEQFMTTEQGVLGGRSPADWLAWGGDCGPVIRLADELGRG